MWKISERLIVFAVLIAVLVPVHSDAQTSLSSPYSAYGIGNLSQVTNIQARSMGGVGIGLRDNFNINIANPASYTGFDSTSFVFEGGAGGHYITLTTDDLNEKYSAATLTHLLFGFPVMKWWKSSFGMLPFSTMGYDAIDFSQSQDVGNTRYIFKGSGGITQAFWGNAIQPTKNISLGVNIAYLFGTMDRVQKVTFPDSANFISSIANSSVSVNNAYFKLGAQYHAVIDSARGVNLVFGATYSPQQDLNARRSTMVRSYLGELSGVPLVMDTIHMIKDEPGKIVIPQGFGVGFSISRKNWWLVSADYEFGAWENYSSFGQSDSLTNSHRFRIGAQITPNPNSFSYIQRIEYRVGGHLTQSYLNLRNKQINGYGITFGTGLPVVSNMIRRTKAMINLGFEVGSRGTLVNGLIREQYFNVYIGISIYEWWFFKRQIQLIVVIQIG